MDVVLDETGSWIEVGLGERHPMGPGWAVDVAPGHEVWASASDWERIESTLRHRRDGHTIDLSHVTFTEVTQEAGALAARWGVLDRGPR